VRVVRRKKQFDEDVGEDANESQSPQEKFKVTYFYHIIDQALTSLKDRFEQFQRYEEIFGFLLNGKFKSISEDKLMEHCSQLQSFLEYKEHCDIYADELFQELRYLKTLLPKDVTKSIDILNYKVLLGRGWIPNSMGYISHFVNYTGYSCFSGKEFL
jgi:hypothetical protein